MTDSAFAQMDAVRVGAPNPEIVALEARLRAAQLAADVAALEALIAPDLLFTGPDGRLATREEDLAVHATAAVRFEAHEPQELRGHRIGEEVAVAAQRARLRVEVGGPLVVGVARSTRVWARQPGGDWRVVAGHVSMMPPGAEE